MMVYRLIFVGTIDKAGSSDSFERVRSTTASLRSVHVISGCLLRGPAYFGQGLEGDRAAIDEFFQTIEAEGDLALAIVESRPDEEPLFSGWHEGAHRHSTYIDEVLSAAHSDVIGARPPDRIARSANAVIKLLQAQSRR